jgi:hypothetical protein
VAGDPQVSPPALGLLGLLTPSDQRRIIGSPNFEPLSLVRQLNFEDLFAMAAPMSTIMGTVLSDFAGADDW